MHATSNDISGRKRSIVQVKSSQKENNPIPTIVQRQQILTDAIHNCSKK